MARHDTRRHILEQGAQLVHEKGFNATGIQEILMAAKVPKGSFYFYFKNKEDFGLQLIDHFRGHFVGLATQHLAQKNLPPLSRLKNLFDDFLHFFTEQHGRLGCPIGNLASEMGDVNDNFRERLQTVLNEMSKAVASFLTAAVETEDLPADFEVADAARFIVNSWEGALVAMKVAGDTRPLELFDRMVFETVLNKGAMPIAGERIGD